MRVRYHLKVIFFGGKCRSWCSLVCLHRLVYSFMYVHVRRLNILHFHSPRCVVSVTAVVTVSGMPPFLEGFLFLLLLPGEVMLL
jgi:hypothetical protein